jgi:hypothetical protein
MSNSISSNSNQRRKKTNKGEQGPGGDAFKQTYPLGKKPIPQKKLFHKKAKYLFAKKENSHTHN